MSLTPRDIAGADLRAELAEVCGTLNVANARLVALTAQAIDQDLWKGWGIRSVEHWLCWQAGLSPAQAKHVVAAAKRYDDLPTVMATFTAGELSLDQVVAVARHTPAHNDAQVARFATCATVTQLRTTLCRQLFSTGSDTDSDDSAIDTRTDDNDGDRGQRSVLTDPDPAGLAEPVDQAQADPVLSMGHDGSRFWLHLDTTAEAGALIEQAVTEAHHRLFADDSEVTWADALLDVCTRSLTAAPAARRDRYRVLIHLDTEGGWVNKGPAIPPALLRKLTCDGTMSPLWRTEGHPVNVGRSTRAIPPHTRALVEDRDRECVFPGCHATRHLEVHHLIHWADGGPTNTSNLACLCDHHHDTHHRGHFTITGNADEPHTLSFIDRNGHPIHPVGTPTPPTGPLPTPPPGRHYQHPSGERLEKRWLYFPPPPIHPRPSTAAPAENPPAENPPAENPPAENPPAENPPAKTATSPPGAITPPAATDAAQPAA